MAKYLMLKHYRGPKTGEIDEGKWTSRGWNRAHNNTCPEAPEAKL